jgi:putative transcription antitermination factor YqgF
MLYQKIVDLLNKNNIEYREIRHEPVKTSEEAVKVRGCKPEEGAKALVFWADKNPIQIIIEGNKKIEKKEFKKQFGFTDLQMVSRDELIKISGVEPGAVPPFGNLFNTPLKIYCNETLLDNEFIEFNAGDHSISIRMNANDWNKLVKPELGQFNEPEANADFSKGPVILCIDYGTKKIGMALYKNQHAIPLKVLDNKPKSGTETEALNEIARVVKDENPQTIIMGIPLLNGKENKETQKIREFGNALKKIINRKIDYIDESHSTDESIISLIEHGVPKEKRTRDDSFAAIVILSRYLKSQAI